MNHPSDHSNHEARGHLARLGESTSNMLCFLDMADRPNVPIAACHDDAMRDKLHPACGTDISAEPSVTMRRRRSLHSQHYPRKPMDITVVKPPPKQLSQMSDISVEKPEPQDITVPARRVSSPAVYRSQEAAVDPEPACSPDLVTEFVTQSVPQECEGEGARQPRRAQRRFFTRSMIEVTSSLSVPMAGAQETMHAFHNDNIVQTHCTSCETFLYCIDVASMVLCPNCRDISHIPNHGSETLILGLGLQVEDVAEEFARLAL